MDMWNRYKAYLIVRDVGYLGFHDFPPLYYHFILLASFALYDLLSGQGAEELIAREDIAGGLDGWLEHMAYIPSPLFLTCIKLPMMVADVLIAILLYRASIEILSLPQGDALKLASLWLFNPFVIFISSCWGMFDAIPALLTLCSFYLLAKKRFRLSALMLALAFACKLYPILILPFWLLYLRHQGKRPALEYLTIFVATSLAIMLPDVQIIQKPIAPLLDPRVKPTMPVGFGLTFWSFCLLFYDGEPPEALILGVAISSIILFGVIYLATLYLALRGQWMRRGQDAHLLSLHALLGLLPPFISYRVVCEQWLIWPLSLLILRNEGRRLALPLSLIALLYSVINCPLPFFLLPMAYAWPSLLSAAIATLVPLIYSIRVNSLVLLGCLATLAFSKAYLSLLTTATAQPRH